MKMLTEELNMMNYVNKQTAFKRQAKANKIAEIETKESYQMCSTHPSKFYQNVHISS